MDPRNNALDTNPPVGDAHLTTKGSSWLWAVLAIFLTSLLTVAALAIKPRRGQRLFHYLFALALLVGALCYFAMAAGLGGLAVLTTLHRADALSYQVFFAKYVYWAVAFPVVAVALGIAAGAAWTVVLFTVGLCWIWVISYLCTACTPSSYKWGFYTLGTLAYLVLALQTLLLPLRQHRTTDSSTGAGTPAPAVHRVAPAPRSHHLLLAGWANLLWLLYPIAVAVSDADNVIGVSGAAGFFGVLDVLLVPALAPALLLLSRSWDLGALARRFSRTAGPGDGGGIELVEKGTGRAAPASAAQGAEGATPAGAAPAGGSAGATTVEGEGTTAA